MICFKGNLCRFTCKAEVAIIWNWYGALNDCIAWPLKTTIIQVMVFNSKWIPSYVVREFALDNFLTWLLFSNLKIQKKYILNKLKLIPTIYYKRPFISKRDTWMGTWQMAYSLVMPFHFCNLIRTIIISGQDNCMLCLEKWFSTII